MRTRTSKERVQFRLWSRPQIGIRWPPVSGSRPSFLARARRGSRSPAFAGPISARALSRSRAAAEQSDPELRSFCRILRRRRDNKDYFFETARFYFFCFYSIPSWRQIVSAAISACRRAWISPRSLGHAVATTFILSTTFLGAWPLFPRWDTSTLLQQRKQQQHL